MTTERKSPEDEKHKSFRECVSVEKIKPEYEYFSAYTYQDYHDPLVASKARKSTVWIKRWTVNEDALLLNIVKKYKGDWKKM